MGFSKFSLKELTILSICYYDWEMSSLHECVSLNGDQVCLLFVFISCCKGCKNTAFKLIVGIYSSSIDNSLGSGGVGLIL